ncbi:MAG: amino acid ABC transporter substrate-binding protein, partial [Syntrophobacterales bacterium]
MKRVKWLIALLLVVGFASMSVAGTLEEIAQRGELRVA